MTSKAQQFITENVRLGYKVMRHKNNKAVSGANSRLSFPIKKGSTIRMPGQGIWMSLDRQYVLDYYAGHDSNVLLTLEFDPSQVIKGNLTDRQTEFSVPSAKIVDFKIYEE